MVSEAIPVSITVHPILVHSINEKRMKIKVAKWGTHKKIINY
jgi:hypothetical protein